jgi:two-component system sensor histidine kinase/response regulator
MTREVVLVVDDSAQNRLVATGHLEHAGYEVVAVASGEAALGYLNDHAVDLVVLDVLMPGLGGFETCRRIRAAPTLAQTPVLFLTALGDRETTEPALQAGGDDLLPKPFNRTELLLRVRSLIRQHRAARELREAARVLAEQNEQLRRLEHDKRRIAELVVHDLKGPLGAILGNMEIVRDYELPPDVAESIGDTVVAVRQLERTVANLLDVSRSEEAAMAPRLVAVDLREVIDEVIASLRSYGKWTNVTLVAHVEVDAMTADRELVRRILQNLVHNAIKHSPQDSTATVRAIADGDGVRLEVSDAGRGVADEDTARIFDRGVSLGGSHGLGLAFCRLATEAHGGQIWVERRPPGTTFCVRIPRRILGA